MRQVLASQSSSEAGRVGWISTRFVGRQDGLQYASLSCKGSSTCGDGYKHCKGVIRAADSHPHLVLHTTVLLPHRLISQALHCIRAQCR